MTDVPLSATNAVVLVLSPSGSGAHATTEPLSFRSRLNAVLAAALAGIPKADRIVLDTDSGGIAVVFLGSISEALPWIGTLGNRLREGQQALPVAAGASFGPVRLARNGELPTVVGDEIDTAEAIAGLASPGQMLASCSLLEGVRAADAANERMFQPIGTTGDGTMQSHELFVLRASPAPASTDNRTRRAPGRRRFHLRLTLAVSAILVAGLTVRGLRDMVEEHRKPAVVKLAITPWADVSVDGVYQGKTPPLKSVEISPGRHKIEIRNPAHPVYSMQVEVKPGQDLEVRHAFLERKRSIWDKFRLPGR